MTQSPLSIRPEPGSSGFRVAAPRLGEVVSGALLTAFVRDRVLPDDMLDLIAQLDQVERPH